MFLGSREEALRVLRVMGDRVCCYLGRGWPRHCDCKYGGPKPDQPGGEQTGCPELASAYAIINHMTDEEWRLIGLRGSNITIRAIEEAFDIDDKGDLDDVGGR